MRDVAENLFRSLLGHIAKPSRLHALLHQTSSELTVSIEEDVHRHEDDTALEMSRAHFYHVWFLFSCGTEETEAVILTPYSQRTEASAIAASPATLYNCGRPNGCNSGGHGSDRLNWQAELHPF